MVLIHATTPGESSFPAYSQVTRISLKIGSACIIIKSFLSLKAFNLFLPPVLHSCTIGSIEKENFDGFLALPKSVNIFPIKKIVLYGMVIFYLVCSLCTYLIIILYYV